MLTSCSVGQASSQPSVVDQKPKLANTILSMSSWAPLNPHEVFTGNLYVSFKKNGWFTSTAVGLLGNIGNFKGSYLIIIFFMSLGSRDLSAKGKSISWSHLLLFLMGRFLFYFLFSIFFFLLRGCNYWWIWSESLLASWQGCLRHLAVLEMSRAVGEATGKQHRDFWLTFYPGVFSRW